VLSLSLTFNYLSWLVGSNFQFFKLLLIDYKDYFKNNILLLLNYLLALGRAYKRDKFFKKIFYDKH
jgi:hypothetical protein